MKYVYRIFNRKTGEPVGSYSRAHHDEFDFPSADSARRANVHGMFEDRKTYRIAKFEIIEREVEHDA